MSDTLNEPTNPRTKRQTAKPDDERPGPVRLKSLTVGGENPGTGVFLPGIGEYFEAEAASARALISIGLAEQAPTGEKG